MCIFVNLQSTTTSYTIELAEALPFRDKMREFIHKDIVCARPISNLVTASIYFFLMGTHDKFPPINRPCGTEEFVEMGMPTVI